MCLCFAREIVRHFPASRNCVWQYHRRRRLNISSRARRKKLENTASYLCLLLVLPLAPLLPSPPSPRRTFPVVRAREELTVRTRCRSRRMPRSYRNPRVFCERAPPPTQPARRCVRLASLATPAVFLRRSCISRESRYALFATRRRRAPNEDPRSRA